VTGAASYGLSRVIATQNDFVWVPRALTRRYCVVAFHGEPGTAATGLDPNATPGWWRVCQTLRDKGALVVQADWDLKAWGGPTLVADIETFRTTKLATLATTLGVANAGILDTSKLVIFSGSMGGCNGYRYQEQQPSHVAGHATVAGASDLTGFYSGTYRWGSDQGTTMRAEIGTAYSVVYPTALPSNADPYDNANLITSPTWIGYSDGDTTVPSAQCTAMATALGANGTAVKVSTTDTHGDAETVHAIDYGIVDWLLAKAS
jgi:pimeloyl-ACP methyl ester carboxylesterase